MSNQYNDPYRNNPYQSPKAVAGAAQFGSAAMAEEWERTAFIRRTYGHLMGAIALFVGLEALLLRVVPGEMILSMLGGWNWLIVLGLFMVVSFVANSWARSATSIATQYAGLGLYVVIQAIIFMPLLFIASRFGGASVIPTAGLITVFLFGGLTLTVFATGANLSWLGRYLALAGFAALGVIVCSILFGFTLGTLFTVIMIAVAAGYILYDTSNVLHVYRTDQHVAASLALFASVAILFWYVLQLVMSMSRD